MSMIEPGVVLECVYGSSFLTAGKQYTSVENPSREGYKDVQEMVVTVLNDHGINTVFYLSVFKIIHRPSDDPEVGETFSITNDSLRDYMWRFSSYNIKSLQSLQQGIDRLIARKQHKGNSIQNVERRIEI